MLQIPSNLIHVAPLWGNTSTLTLHPSHTRARECFDHLLSTFIILQIQSKLAKVDSKMRNMQLFIKCHLSQPIIYFTCKLVCPKNYFDVHS